MKPVPLRANRLDIELPALHPLQRQVMEDPARFKVLACGRRWGKTRLGVLSALAVALSGGFAWWVAPSYKMGMIGWRGLYTLARQIPGATIQKTELRAEIPGGGWFQIRSADEPDSLRGEGLDYVAVDECAFVDERAWTEALRPALSDRKGSALFISTPRGMNWFWRHWQKGQRNDGGAWKSWSFPSRTNPYLDPSEIEEARKDLPERIFAQEYEAAFLEEAGGVFHGVMSNVDRDRTQPEQPFDAAEYFLGVDLAKYGDFTVLCVLARDGRQVYHERFNRISWALQRAAIVRVGTEYNNAVISIDGTGVGDPIVEEIERVYGGPVEPIHYTNKTKVDEINNLALAFENRALSLMDVPAQTSELLAYQYETTRFGNVRMSAPSGMNDDCVTALARAEWARSATRELEFS